MISIFQDRTRDYVLPPIEGDKGEQITPTGSDDYRWRIYRDSEQILEITNSANANGSVLTVSNDRLVLTLDQDDAATLKPGLYDGELHIVVGGKSKYRGAFSVVVHQLTTA